MKECIFILLLLAFMPLGCLSRHNQHATHEQSDISMSSQCHVGYWISTTNLPTYARAILNQLAGNGLIIQSVDLPEETNSVELTHCECFSIHPPEAMCDGFTHTIYINRALKQYWVLRTGGYAGTRTLYGPGKYDE